MDESFEALARYNAEVARGLVHTPEWAAEMARVQRAFDEQAAAAVARWRQPDGAVVLPARMPGGVLEAVLRVLRGR
jgi:hypothetical protein